MIPRLLYHITHRRNLKNILAQGIAPARARTKWGTVWLVAGERVPELIRHMMKRHHWKNADHLRVIRVTVNPAALRRNRAPAIYHYPHTIPVSPDQVMTVAQFEEQTEWTT